MGSPGAELPRGTTRPACGVAQTVPLGHSHATFRPRPICGSCFYAVLLIPATFNDSGLSGHRGEYLFTVGAEDKDKIIQDSRFNIQELVRLPVDSKFKIQELVRLPMELVRLLPYSRFKI